MAPAFGLVEAKALYPYFFRSSNSVSHSPIYFLPRTHVQAERPITRQLADQWHDVVLDAESGHCAIIDVRTWASHAALDAYVWV